SDKALAIFHKTLEEQKKDEAAFNAANKQFQDLIDRLTRVLDAMGDITTINKLIEQLLAIYQGEQEATQRFKDLHSKLQEKYLEEQFGPSSKPPEKKEK